MASQLAGIDVVKFLKLVRERRCLWDLLDSNYHLRYHHRKSWIDISSEMNIPVDHLKKKWRGLRDTFGKELKKANKSDPGKPAEQVSKWHYFKMLLFLRDQLFYKEKEKRKQSESLCETDFEGTCDSNLTDSPMSDTQSYYRSIQEHSEPTSSEQFKSPLRKKIKQELSDQSDEILIQSEESIIQENEDDAEKLESSSSKRIKQEMTEHGDEILPRFEEKILQKKIDDSDVQFLMSLLPFLRDIPKHRKLIVRSHLLHVLIDEQNAVMQK